MHSVCCRRGVRSRRRCSQLATHKDVACCAPGSDGGSGDRVLLRSPQRVDVRRCGRHCALHCRVCSLGPWNIRESNRVGDVRNTASCSFPLMTFIALYVIDQRQEHNSVLRFRQFGHLYDRCPVSLDGRQSRLIGWFAHMLSIGTSRTAHSFSRWSPSLGAVRRALVCVCARACVRACVCVDAAR